MDEKCVIPEIIHEIIHYLGLLKVLNITTDDNISRIRSFLESMQTLINRDTENNDIPDNISIQSEIFSSPGTPPIQILPPIEPEQEIIPIPNPIIDVPNKTLKIGFIRNITDKSVTYTENSIIYNKKQYMFDNIFHNNDNQKTQLLFELSNFIYMRAEARKSSAVILYAYSGSGKSTLCNSLLELLTTHRKYILSEIYLNKIYIYHNGKKCELTGDNPYDEKYAFTCDPKKFMRILEAFQRKSETDLNSQSSRSHIIISCYDHNGTVCRIIDLCGNERASKKISLFKKKETHEKEMTYINKSLYSVSRFLKDNKYKDGSCSLLNKVLKPIVNIVFVLLFNDNQELRLNSLNHLMIFDIFKTKKIK